MSDLSSVSSETSLDLPSPPPPPDQESSGQMWQDAVNFVLKARILTGRKEFEDPEKVNMILDPTNDDVCSFKANTMMGSLTRAMEAGEYRKEAEGAVEDIIIPIRYAVKCSGKNSQGRNKFVSFFTNLFSNHKDDPETYTYKVADLIVMLLAFHYSTLAFSIPGITIDLLARFEQSVLSGAGLQGSIGLLPPQLQKVINASLQIPRNKLNTTTISQYFGGNVPFLLIFREDAMDVAMNIASMNGEQTISVQGDTSNTTGTIPYTGDNDSSNKPEKPIILTQGQIGDAAQLFIDVNKDLRLNSGRVAGYDSD